MAVPPPARRARPFPRRICSSSSRSLPAPRARPAAARCVRISSRSLPARPGRVRTLLRAWTAAPAAIPAGARAPGVSRARLSGGGARIGGRPAARCPSTEAHAPPIWKESVCLLHSILRQGPQSTAIRPLRRRTKHPRRVKNPDQPHDSRPRSITPPRAAAKKSDQTPPCRHPSVDVSAHPSPWRGDQAAGASRGRRQPSGQRPRCPSAGLPVASRAWRAQSPPRIPYGGKGERPAQAGRSSLRAIAGLNFPHASRVGTHRRVKFLPRVAGEGIRRRAHRAAGGNHPGSGPVVRQPACRSRAWRAQSPPRIPYGGKGERPAQAGRSSLRAIARRRKRAGGAQTPEIGACKSARRVVE